MAKRGRDATSSPRRQKRQCSGGNLTDSLNRSNSLQLSLSCSGAPSNASTPMSRSRSLPAGLSFDSNVKNTAVSLTSFTDLQARNQENAGNHTVLPINSKSRSTRPLSLSSKLLGNAGTTNFPSGVSPQHRRAASSSQRTGTCPSTKFHSGLPVDWSLKSRLRILTSDPAITKFNLSFTARGLGCLTIPPCEGSYSFMTDPILQKSMHHEAAYKNFFDCS